MTFDEMVVAAAHAAEDAVSETMNDYKKGYLTDEDDITGYLLGALRTTFRGSIGGLTWRASPLRHRSGVAAEEKRIGADMLIHIRLSTPTHTYSKGVLIQAKRYDAGVAMNAADHADLIGQCSKMLTYTPASFVFDYARGEMRCASASKIAGMQERGLYANCDWTSYRFFLELFRCSVGDRKIHSGLVKDLSIPQGISIRGQGQLTPQSPLV